MIFKRFIQLFALFFVLDFYFLYAPPKQNPKGKNVAKAKGKAKTIDSDDALLDAILSDPNHQIALGKARNSRLETEEQKKEQALSQKFRNLTPAQQKKATEFFKLLDGDFSVKGYSQQVFDFINTIQDPVIINVQNLNGMTALMFFSEIGELDIVRLLLEKKANPNLRDNTNWTALMYGAEMSNEAVVALLLEQRVNVDQQNDEDHATALVLAIGTVSVREATNIVRMLLDAGANPNIPDSFNMNPLMFAAQEGYFDIVKLLVDHKASLNEQNDDKKTALMIAAQDSHVRVVGLLLSLNADTLIEDQKHWTALMFAAQAGNTEMMQMILNHEARNKNKDAITVNKLKALIVASRLGFAEIAQTLLQSGIPVKALGNGENPLFIAAQFGHKQIVEMLLADGFPVDIKEAFKATPLMVAAYYNRLDILNILLAAGADPLLQDQEGKTALILAQEQGHKDAAKVLKVAMLEQKNKKRTLRDSYQKWQTNHFGNAQDVHIAKQDMVRQKVEAEEELERAKIDMDFDSDERPLAPSPILDWNDGWDEDEFIRIQEKLRGS